MFFGIFQWANETNTIRSSQRATHRPNVPSWLTTHQTRRDQRRQRADSDLLTAAVSVGTNHRPFWCLLPDAPFGLIAFHIITTSGDFRTEESDLLRRQPMRSRPARITARDTDRGEVDKTSSGGSGTTRLMLWSAHNLSPLTLTTQRRWGIFAGAVSTCRLFRSKQVNSNISSLVSEINGLLSSQLRLEAQVSNA